jgi:UDP-2,4-diacetamido-2,4,6-trideoxy-beta-L-altropyranose hydrolase
MRVAVRVDAGPLIGGGHAMRCLTLADELARHGAEVTFVTAAMPEGLAKRIEASGHQVAEIAAPAGLKREGTDWHGPALPAAEQTRDARATGAAVGQVDWLIVDHYLLDADWHSAGRSFADRLLVVDDLANRSYDCDLLVDETGGRTSAAYEGLVPSGNLMLAGASYALLRPEFASERPAAFQRREKPRAAEQILISLGMTDPDAITARAVEAAIVAAPGCGVDVVLAEDAASLPRVREIADSESGISIHINSNRMAELMRDADLAIGAAGTTSWERCCVGLPAAALVLADNQRENADALAAAEAAIKLEHLDEIGPAVGALIGDEQRLHRMSAAAFQLTDGLGTSRVVEAMIGVGTRASRVRA